MKKLLLTVLIVSMLYMTAASAETGKIHSVSVLTDGKVQVVLDIGGSGNAGDLRYANIVGDAEKVKKILAMVLTAKTTDTEVNVGFGAGGWNRVSMQ